MFKLRGSCFHPNTGGLNGDNPDLERKPSKKWSKKLRKKYYPGNSSNGTAVIDDVLLLRKEYSYIELIRESNQPLGVIFSGGVDQASPIIIQEISPDSIAAKSEAVQVGDIIRAINGMQTNQMKHAEVADILLNSGPVISLQLEFDSAQGPTCGFEKSKITCLTFPKENFHYGFSLDGPEGAPLTDEFELRVSHIYPGSSPYQLGLLKPGDKLLSINGISLKGASLRDATTLIYEGGDISSFEVEYPVAIHDNLKSAKGPYTLELLRTPGSSLGLSLIGSPIPGGPIIISSIKAGSIADRSGALYIGDQIISINGQNIQGLSVIDSSKLLQLPTVRVALELLPDNSPYPRNPYFSKDFHPTRITNCDSLSQLNSSTADFGFRSGAMSSQSIRSTMTLQRLPARQESLIVQLNPTLDGYGISMDSLSHTSSGPVVIGNIDYNSPAYLCGVLLEGDRVLTVNDRPIHSATQCQQLLLDSLMQNRILDLLVELDVNEAVSPSSGTFNIKLMRGGLSSLGVTLNGPVQGERGAIWIGKIKKGGIAYRSGSLQVGDVLLSINGQSLANCTLTDAVNLLQEPEDVVTLKISKETQLLGPKLCEFNSITYTVELPKDKGNLGISIRGTNTTGSSVIISHLMERGVASRTEAIHVGDEILSINGVSLRSKTLLECAKMLEDAEIVVGMQIRKQDPLTTESLLAQQNITDYHVQCSVASPIHNLGPNNNKQNPQTLQPLPQANAPPPIRAKPQFKSVTSYPIDSHRIAQEAALKGRWRSNTAHSTINSNLPPPVHTDNPCRRSTEMQSTSLTNITHIDRGSSIDSEGSSMYNSSPSPPQKRVPYQPREPSNLTKFIGGSNVPIRMHRSVEVLPHAMEMTGLGEPNKNVKSRTMERGARGLLRDNQFTPVHETDEMGVYSIPMDQQEGNEQVPFNTDTTAPVLPHRNPVSNQTIPLSEPHSQRSVSAAGWLDVNAKETLPQPRIVVTSQSNYVTLDTNSPELLEEENKQINTNHSPVHIQHRFREPSFDSEISKNSNQEVKKVKLQKLEKQSFGFSISDGNGNMGVFVKNVDSGSVAERGDLKPLDKLLAINGISLKELNCDRTLKLLQSSKGNLNLLVSRLTLSSKNQTL